MFSVTTPLQIKNNPTNTSTSKNHWSFGKANRFPSPKSKYLFILSSVAINHFMINAHAYLIVRLLLALVIEVNILVAFVKFQNLANISLFRIFKCRRKVGRDLALLLIVKISGLITFIGLFKLPQHPLLISRTPIK